MAFPGRDDTTRGAGDTGGALGAVSVEDGGVVAAGGVTTLVTTVAGGSGDSGADGVTTSALATCAGASGTARASGAAVVVVFLARVVFGFVSSSPVAAFLARLGLSTIGSPFRPFSSA